MKLTHAEIRRYRSISEPTSFDVESDVTCLVGKNESGKTAILQALYKSFPVGSSSCFDTDLDYPSHLTREIKGNKRVKVTKLTYELDEADIAAVEDVIGPNSLSNNVVSIDKSYNQSECTWSVPVDDEKVLHFLRSQLDLPQGDTERIEKADTVEKFIEIMDALESKTPSSDDVIERINGWRNQSPSLAAIDVLHKRRPKFVYFGDYDVMPGKVSIPRLIDKEHNDTLERGEEALLALLSLAGVELSDFISTDNHEHLIRQMENASNTISDEVFEYWSQNKELSVELKDISSPEPGAEPPLDLAPLLQVRVRNQRHRVTVPFDERSRGFVWFFSFLAYFSKLESESEYPLVLLLDEPGLNLHATAQNDLLRFIDERLAPKHQVIFTTHSPFMINPHNIKRVRTVVDDRTRGTSISDDVLRTDKESTFPLHAALGIELTQTLFVGPHVLLVEGPSDVIFLQFLSEQLRQAGKEFLDERWTLVPGGGITKLPAFLSLFGANNLTVACLSDSSVENRRILAELKKTGKLYNASLVQVGDALDKTEADIEDLLPESLYIELVNEAYAGQVSKDPLKVSDVPDGDRITKRVESVFSARNINNGHLNHFAPAGALLRRDTTSGLTESILCRAEKLIKEINSLLK